VLGRRAREGRLARGDLDQALTIRLPLEAVS
jgi:hypothetical protein